MNDVRNIIPSIHYALEAGMTPQATLCITNSPIHTAEYYAKIADQLIEAGAPEICLKDMAGLWVKLRGRFAQCAFYLLIGLFACSHGICILVVYNAKLLQKSEMRKDIVIELSYKGFG